MTAATSECPYVDPEAEMFLARLRASGEPSAETIPAAEARRISNARVLRANFKGPTDLDVQDSSVQTSWGSVRVRIYRPFGASAAHLLPLLFYFHGGGMVVGGVEICDAQCRILSKSANCVVVSTEYRLAPENKFPAAITDCMDVVTWAIQNAATIGVDRDRIAIMGESSGGTLAAVVAHQLRDKAQSGLRLQILVYPNVDISTDWGAYDRLGNNFFYDRMKLDWFHRQYIRTDADRANALASPIRSETFRGLPPSLIITASLDPLVDEGEAYANKLRAAQVPVTYHCFEGWPHGFFYWGGSTAGLRTLDMSIDALKTALTPQP